MEDERPTATELPAARGLPCGAPAESAGSILSQRPRSCGTQRCTRTSDASPKSRDIDPTLHPDWHELDEMRRARAARGASPPRMRPASHPARGLALLTRACPRPGASERRRATYFARRPHRAVNGHPVPRWFTEGGRSIKRTSAASIASRCCGRRRSAIGSAIRGHGRVLTFAPRELASAERRLRARCTHAMARRASTSFCERVGGGQGFDVAVGARTWIRAG
jgi:hypothetical protein